MYPCGDPSDTHCAWAASEQDGRVCGRRRVAEGRLKVEGLRSTVMTVHVVSGKDRPCKCRKRDGFAQQALCGRH